MFKVQLTTMVRIVYRVGTKPWRERTRDGPSRKVKSKARKKRGERSLRRNKFILHFPLGFCIRSCSSAGRYRILYRSCIPTRADTSAKPAEAKRKPRNCLWEGTRHKIELCHYGEILVTPQKEN